jgi:hypothetical protein
MALSHSAAFRKQASFNPDSKIKVGKNVWREEQSGHRLYAEVLSKHPATVTEAFTLAGKLKQPFTPGQVMGHLKWMYTDGELEVDGKSYVVQAKPKVPEAKNGRAPLKPEPKPEQKDQAKHVTEAAKREAKGLPSIVQPARKRTPVKTKKAA